MHTPTEQALISAIAAASTSAHDWLLAACARQRNSSTPEIDFAASYALARRGMGTTPLGVEAMGMAAGSCDARDWSTTTAGRAVLLLQLVSRAPDAAPALVRRVFRQGDEAEQADLVRSLPLLEHAASLKQIALEAGRTNSRALFAALALGNPYPARHYSEPEFNQLVLKALFLELPIERIVGLRARANPELARMAEDYVEEREAAGRAVPPDIWLAIGPHASPRGRAMLARYRASPLPAHRRYAAGALGQTPP